MLRCAFLAVLACFIAAAQAGRGGLPNATPAQTAALAQMNTGLSAQTQALAAARTALTAAALTNPTDIQTKLEAVKAADLALAKARGDAFAKLQASPNRLARSR